MRWRGEGSGMGLGGFWFRRKLFELWRQFGFGAGSVFRGVLKVVFHKFCLLDCGVCALSVRNFYGVTNGYFEMVVGVFGESDGGLEIFFEVLIEGILGLRKFGRHCECAGELCKKFGWFRCWKCD